jgi:predicted amidohydrolase
MKALHIKGGRVIDPANHVDEVRDVYLDGGKVVANLPDKAEIIDATGRLVVPGLIDIHVHLREPGRDARRVVDLRAWSVCLTRRRLLITPGRLRLSNSARQRLRV